MPIAARGVLETLDHKTNYVIWFDPIRCQLASLAKVINLCHQLPFQSNCLAQPKRIFSLRRPVALARPVPHLHIPAVTSPIVAQLFAIGA